MLAIDVDIDPTLAPSVVNLVVLAAASAFASKDETQYYLNGVRVEFDETGATYVATDGHRMICFRDDLMQGKNLLVGSFIIPTAHCKHFKIGKEDDGYGKMFQEHERLTIAYGFVDVRFAPIEGPYPNWRRIIPPSAASGALAQYNLLLLADFQKFATAVGITSPFVAANGDGPSPIWFPGFPHAMGMMMPMKITDELGREPPGWTRRRPGNDDQGDLEDAIDESVLTESNVEDLNSRKKRA